MHTSVRIAISIGFALVTGLPFATAQLSKEESRLLTCAAENNGGAIFVISMIELQGENQFLSKLKDRLQFTASEHILEIEAEQVERFAPEDVPNEISAETTRGLVERTAFVIDDLSTMLARSQQEALIGRLVAAPNCAEELQ